MAPALRATNHPRKVREQFWMREPKSFAAVEWFLQEWTLR